MSEPKQHPIAARAAAHALCTTLLDSVIEPVRLVARDAGYAIAVHGSLARDIDLIAVPWVERVAKPEYLAERIAAVIAGLVGRCNLMTHGDTGGFEEKPHGRRACTILVYSELFGHVDIDLSFTAAESYEP